jgi:predicted unusual protein kinase regulating ubiquinone biosynthesis (AarF/ABC1/UbiB family)
VLVIVRVITRKRAERFGGRHKHRAEPASLPSDLLCPTVPPTPFRHPFEESSIVWRGYFLVRRLATLSYVFAPCAVASCLRPLLPRHGLDKRYLALLVSTLERAGAGFQKLGQWMSMRPDQFDEAIIEALSSLRDDGPRHSFAHTRDLVEAAFGCGLEQMFERFDQLPVASGSKFCAAYRT